MIGSGCMYFASFLFNLLGSHAFFGASPRAAFLKLMKTFFPL